MKKLICMLLAFALVFSLAACGPKDPVEDPATEPSTDAPSENEQPTENEQPAFESDITYFQLSYMEGENIKNLTAYPNEDGTAYVEFVGTEKKIGNLDVSVLETIADELAKTALPALNGMSEYAEGDVYASMYISFADETMLSADFGGTAPQEFIDGYAAMEACFAALTADLAVYVPELGVMGEVNPDGLAAMQEIMNGTGFTDLDNYSVSDVALDEYFADTVGLTGSTGIANATLCSAMMMTTPYSLVIVTLEDAANIDAVRADFAANINWQKFVCVIPSDALIAQKGNMVLFLMGSDALFESTKTAIENAGWLEIEGFTNPDM